MAAKKKQKAPLPREALELIAQRFKALADPTRLALLQSLFEGEKTVQELCELTGTGQANASKHLSVLAEQGLVARRKDGLFARYRIDDPTVRALCDLVCGSLARRLDEARSKFGLAD